MRDVLSTSDLQTSWWGGQIIADHLVQGLEPEEELDEPQYARDVELTEIFRER
jgi:hypothetical protein